MKTLITCLIIGLSATLSLAEEVKLPRSTPEAEGVSSAGIREFVETADKNVKTMHSFMMLRHGKVVAECWWKPDHAENRHVLHSLSKSFTSTAVGLAVAEGKLKLDDKVLSFFPDDAPAEVSDNLKAMRVRDLLTMSTGHETEPKMSADQPWVKIFLAHPVKREPGSLFVYNTPATYMQSAIVQKVTGQTVLEFLRTRLFEPLGIENPQWGTSPQGVTLGGYGLHIRTEDIAKFGQLYLQQGKWNGKQLVPADWIAQATKFQVPNDKTAAGLDKGGKEKSDWQQGYGFQFWQCRHGAFRGDGASGQFCIVLPKQEVVIAITAASKDMQGQLNIVWDKLLPAIQDQALPANDAELQKLKEVLSTLTAGQPREAKP